MSWPGPRVVRPQLLNTVSREDAQASLADLVFLNRWFGGHRVIRSLLRQVVPHPNDAFTLLDVGAASGDSGRVIQAAYPNARITSLDHHAPNLTSASPPKLVADAFALPFANASFDFVFSSLFLHHFSETQVVALLREFARLARRAILIADVERHPLARRFLPISRHLFRWHWVTVHDGAVSVSSAFTRTELLQLAQQAGLQHISIAAHRPAFRLSLIGRTTPLAHPNGKNPG